MSSNKKNITAELATLLDTHGFQSLRDWAQLTGPWMDNTKEGDLVETSKKAVSSGEGKKWTFFLQQIIDGMSTSMNAEIAKQQATIDNLNKEVASLRNQITEGTGEVANLHARIADGIKELATEQGKVAALEKIVVDRSAAGTTSTTTITTDSTTKDSASPHPAPFNGSEKDTAKRTSLFRTWRTKVAIRWGLRSTEFGTEKARILYAAALLEGPAADGVINGVQKVADSDDPEDWPWATGKDFLDHLADKYATLDLAADAENKLRDLYQGGRFANFNDFLTELINLADMCGWDDVTRVRALREKMNQEMRTAFRYQADVPATNEFSKWVKLAQKLAVNIENDHRKNKSFQGYGQNNGGNRPQNQGADKGDAMDIDGMRINRVSQEERDRRAAKGLCYRCGQPGHIGRDCQNNRRDGQPARAGNNNNRGGYQQRGGYSQPYRQNNGQGYQGYQAGGYGYNNPGPAQRQNGAWGQQYGYGGDARQNQYDAPARRGGMRGGGYNGGGSGYNGGGGGGRQNVRFMDVVQPGYVVGEVASDSQSNSQYGNSQFGQYDHEFVPDASEQSDQGKV